MTADRWRTRLRQRVELPRSRPALLSSSRTKARTRNHNADFTIVDDSLALISCPLPSKTQSERISEAPTPRLSSLPAHDDNDDETRL